MSDALHDVLRREADAAVRLVGDLALRRCAGQLALTQAMLRCRTPQDLLIAQSDALVEELELMVGGLKAFGHLVSAAAGETVRLIDSAAASA